MLLDHLLVALKSLYFQYEEIMVAMFKLILTKKKRRRKVLLKKKSLKKKNQRRK